MTEEADKDEMKEELIRRKSKLKRRKLRKKLTNWKILNKKSQKNRKSRMTRKTLKIIERYLAITVSNQQLPPTSLSTIKDSLLYLIHEKWSTLRILGFFN